jgi:hypothetical protein
LNGSEASFWQEMRRSRQELQQQQGLQDSYSGA